MKIIKWGIIIATCWLSQAYADNVLATAKFLSFSDIHFTPFASCKTLSLSACPLVNALRKAPAAEWDGLFKKFAGQDKIAGIGHDTNYTLLQASLAAIRNVNARQKTRFAIIPGDFLAHNFRAQYMLYARDKSVSGYQSFVRKTLEFLTLAIRKAIPDGDIYAAVGNNDSYNGDYAVVPDGAFLHDMATTWSALITDKKNLQSFQQSFPAGGYYAVDIPDRQKLLVLNTVLFSSSVTGPHVREAAEKELAWLHAELSAAVKAKQSVFIVCHIPLGVNVYVTMMNLLRGINEFWQHQDSAVFTKDLQDFATTVKAVLPGHLHRDGFQVFGLRHVNDVPVSFTPSISPIFGNNPAFKVYSYNAAKMQLTAYDVYFHSLQSGSKNNVWEKEYSFNMNYPENCAYCHLINAIKNIAPPGTEGFPYKQYYSMNSQTIIRLAAMPYYWCDVAAMSRTGTL
jgi:sphingomyelin phosphodiesterase acid-like 3